MPALEHRHLNYQTLAKLAGLQLRFQAVVEGTLAGIHSSPRYGSSIEFAEHKEYTPGDDVRYLDWKALGKFDRYFIKRFEDETDLKAYLVLDCSGSMGYGAPLSKLEYGSVLVASLSFFLIRQGDKPGLLAFAEKVQHYIPPRARSAHMAEILFCLEALRAEGGTNLGDAIRQLSEFIAPRSLVLVVTDLFDTREDTLSLLRHLRSRHHYVVLFHLLHPDELELPFSEVTVFESMEDQRQILVDPGAIRKSYLSELNRFLQRTRTFCNEGGIEYHQVSLAEPLDRVLLRFLRASKGKS